MDPELAHDVGLGRLSSCLPRFCRPPSGWPPIVAPPVLGSRFSHPLGLAAGFDKNGDYLDALGALGFSHIELGTVTPRPQTGNPKPRMFRVPNAARTGQSHGVQQQGRRSLGGAPRAQRLSGHPWHQHRQERRYPSSSGPRKDTPACLRKVYAYADYIAVNISSPNTARLRELQERDGLQRIIGAVLDAARASLQPAHGKLVPLLVKVAPDLERRSSVGARRKLARARGRRGHRDEYLHPTWRFWEPHGRPRRTAA